MKVDPTFLLNTLWNFFTDEYQRLRAESPEAELPVLVREALVPSIVATQDFFEAVQLVEDHFDEDPQPKRETSATKILHKRYGKDHDETATD